MTQPMRIGSRDSKLAQWQAKEVERQLNENQVSTEIHWIKSIGDLVQDKPLSSIGTVGVFTKALDEALLNHSIDIAVHSCKDLPSQLHPELTICAYLERENSEDVIVSNNPIDFINDVKFSGIIATGSVRRKAQLLSKFPDATIVGLRGNVPTRLKKLKESNWSGAVFAHAGLKRLKIQPKYLLPAEFMVSAPAQGVVAIVCRKEDKTSIETCKKITHLETEITTKIERKFLRLMEGGCISPIGAKATIHYDKILFSVSVLSTNGAEKVEFTDEFSRSQWEEIAEQAYKKAVQLGAVKIIKAIENA